MILYIIVGQFLVDVAILAALLILYKRLRDGEAGGSPLNQATITAIMKKSEENKAKLKQSIHDHAPSGAPPQA